MKCVCILLIVAANVYAGQNSPMPEPATACLFLVAAAVGLCRHPRQRGSRRVPHMRKLIRNCMARRKLSRPLPVTR